MNSHKKSCCLFRVLFTTCCFLLLFTIASSTPTTVYKYSEIASLPFTVQAAKTDSNVFYSRPVYAWFFGYVGGTFYPRSELGISQSEMLEAAKNLSQIFGKNNLVLVTAVNEIPLPGGTINNTMITPIRSYVIELKKYASAVYGRLDMQQFNLSTLPGYGSCTLGGGSGPWYDCPIYNQSSLYVNQLGLDGIWFDHPTQYNDVVGNLTFNEMMQNLTTLLPSTKFLINQTPGARLGYTVELDGFTWMNDTYAVPSVQSRNLALNQNQEAIVYDNFFGHVIVHFDADGPPGVGSNKGAPMSVFAAENASAEISTLTSILYNGTHPNAVNESYSTVIPVIGSWTYNASVNGGPDYNGTLYNALSIGNYARSTVASFEQAVITTDPEAQISASRSPVDKDVTITGNYFLGSSPISIYFDDLLLMTVETNSSGYFSESITVPPSPDGLNNITVSDGANTVDLDLSVTPAFFEHPSRGSIGSNITIEGEGYLPDATVRIYFDGVIVTTIPVTNSSGGFLTTYIVPDKPPGSYSVIAKESSTVAVTVNFRIN